MGRSVRAAPSERPNALAHRSPAFWIHPTAYNRNIPTRRTLRLELSGVNTTSDCPRTVQDMFPRYQAEVHRASVDKACRGLSPHSDMAIVDHSRGSPKTSYGTTPAPGLPVGTPATPLCATRQHRRGDARHGRLPELPVERAPRHTPHSFGLSSPMPYDIAETHGRQPARFHGECYCGGNGGLRWWNPPTTVGTNSSLSREHRHGSWKASDGQVIHKRRKPPAWKKAQPLVADA